MATTINRLTPATRTDQSLPIMDFNLEEDGTASTGRTLIDWHSNTGTDHAIGFIQQYRLNKNPYNNNRQFIKLWEAFNTGLKKCPELNAFQSHLKEKMKFSANLLLKIAPEKIGLQLTDDGAIYYTVIINDLTLYFSHYLNADTEEIDEFLVSIYKGDQNILNASGAIHEVLPILNKALGNYNLTIPELA